MNINNFIMGAGGHCKVVLEIFYQLGLQCQVFDKNSGLAGQFILSNVIELYRNDVVLPAYGHLAIGDNQIRKILDAEIRPAIKGWLTVVHPQASVSEFASIDEGCAVAARAIIGPEVKIGPNSIINHAAVVDHDCVIGAFSHIAPNATLGGGVSVGREVLIGSGAVILPGIEIGDGAVIGSGAVVTRDIPEGDKVIGTPARSML